jgi:hypothetical protein
MRAWFFAGTLLTLGILGTAAPARAAMTQFDGVSAPLIRVTLLSGNVQISTWDRPQVRIDAADGVSVERKSVNLPGQREIPIFEGRIQGRSGVVVLPAETFVVNTLPPGRRDLIAVTGKGNVALVIPASAPLVVVQLVTGSTTLRDYRTGTFIVRLRSGVASFSSVGGEGYVQVMRGAVLVSQSAIERLRVRTALAGVYFEQCHLKQIDATSVEGSVVFDDGSFEPGLARFSSESGSVALGIAGGANITAHAADGQIYTLFDKRSSATVSGGDANATINGGGPLVTASSATADVYLYNGTLRNRRDLPESWLPFVRSIQSDLRALNAPHLQ